MREYVKINTMFKRDTSPGGRNRIIEGDWATPEIGYLASCDWQWSEKVDGTNIRVEWDGDKVHYGGRTDSAQIPVPLLNALDAQFRTREGLERFAAVFPNGGAVLFGEGYGPKIQKGGGRYASEPSFVLFDVLAGGLYLERHNVEDVAAKLGLNVVPLIGNGSLAEAAVLVKNGLQSRWGDFEAEGIVARPTVELQTRRGERIIAKIKARDFR